jgi:hypothetical protein
MTARLSKVVAALCAATAMTGYAAAAHATVVLDLVNAPVQVDTPFTFMLTATSTVTSLTIEGFDKASILGVSHESLQLNGAGANLLGATWVLFETGPGTETAQYSLGTGVNALGFGSVDGFDGYVQDIATVSGSNYTLSFLFSKAAPRNASELLVTTNAKFAEISPAGGGGGNPVPEPATWALMLVGFGALGATLRQGRRQARAQTA